MLYQDEIHGSILEQIDKIVELVYLKYMRAKITYEGMQRIERYFVCLLYTSKMQPSYNI